MSFKKLGSVSKIRRGASPRPIDDPRYFGGEVGWVRISDVSASNKYLRKTTQYVSELGEKNSVRVNKGDLILSICGTVGKPIIIDIPACIHDGFVQVYDLNESNSEFLYYVLQHSEERLKGQGQSGTQTNLNTSIVGNLEIFHPSIEEQTAIAEVLGKIDSAIEKTNKLIEKQKRIKQGLMQDLLTKGIDEHGNIRNEKTHRFKDSPLGRIPEEWNACNIEEIKDFITSGSRGWAKYYSPEGDKFIRIGNLSREDVTPNLENLICVKPPNNSEGKRTSLQENDVLVSITADLGIIGIVPPNFGNSYINQHIALVRLDEKKICPKWVAYYLASNQGQHQFSLIGDSGAKAGMNLPTVGSLMVAKPTIEEQENICKLIDDNLLNIEQETKRKAKLNFIKKGLMQDLLTGKKSVNNLISE